MKIPFNPPLSPGQLLFWTLPNGQPVIEIWTGTKFVLVEGVSSAYVFVGASGQVRVNLDICNVALANLATHAPEAEGFRLLSVPPHLIRAAKWWEKISSISAHIKWHCWGRWRRPV